MGNRYNICVASPSISHETRASYLGCFFFSIAHAHAELTNVNTGIIAYNCRNDGAHYLLAYDPHLKRMGWGTFGGRSIQGELASQTAIREFHEETNCIYTAQQRDSMVLSGPSKVTC